MPMAPLTHTLHSPCNTVFDGTDAPTAIHQQIGIDPAAANLLLQQQVLGNVFANPPPAAAAAARGASLMSPANILLGSQMQQAAHQPRPQQHPGNSGNDNDQSQQLAAALQQQLWAASMAAVASNALAAAPNLNPDVAATQQVQQPSSNLAALNPQVVAALLSQLMAQQQQQLQQGTGQTAAGLVNPQNAVGLVNPQNAAGLVNPAVWLTNASSAAASLAGPSFGSTTSSSTTVPTSNHSTLLTNQGQSALNVAGHTDNPLPQYNTAKLTGRPSVTLYISCDDDSLSEYQCLARKQIELFEAGREEVESNAQGRNRPIVMGQVGIRCRHCTMLPPKHRARGAVYYPAKLHGKCPRSFDSECFREFCNCAILCFQLNLHSLFMFVSSSNRDLPGTPWNNEREKA